MSTRIASQRHSALLNQVSQIVRSDNDVSKQIQSLNEICSSLDLRSNHNFSLLLAVKYHISTLLCKLKSYKDSALNLTTIQFTDPINVQQNISPYLFHQQLDISFDNANSTATQSFLKPLESNTKNVIEKEKDKLKYENYALDSLSSSLNPYSDYISKQPLFNDRSSSIYDEVKTLIFITLNLIQDGSSFEEIEKNINKISYICPDLNSSLQNGSDSIYSTFNSNLNRISNNNFQNVVDKSLLQNHSIILHILFKFIHVYSLFTFKHDFLTAAYKFYELSSFCSTAKKLFSTLNNTEPLFFYIPLIEQLFENNVITSVIFLLISSLCTILSPSGTRKSSVLSMLYNDNFIQEILKKYNDHSINILENSDKYKILLEDFNKVVLLLEKLYFGRIINKNDVDKFRSILISDNILLIENSKSKDIGIEWNNISNLYINASISEHNILYSTRIYKSLRFSRLKDILLESDIIKCQSIIGNMIREGRLSAQIDQEGEFIKFFNKVLPPCMINATKISDSIYQEKDMTNFDDGNNLENKLKQFMEPNYNLLDVTDNNIIPGTPILGEPRLGTLNATNNFKDKTDNDEVIDENYNSTNHSNTFYKIICNDIDHIYNMIENKHFKKL